MKESKVNQTVWFWLAVLFSGLALLAATVSGAEPGATTTATTTQPVNWAMLLIPVVVPVVIAIAKMLIPKLPKWTLPILAPLLGAAADYLATNSFGNGTIMGVIAGFAGVGLRELVDQLRKANSEPGPQ